tara:strand:+ start:12359 stop:13006 length:648 start_codon:yes stop_codon:yes gene_type:complete
MATDDRSIGFCKVLTGFTGSLTVTVGASTVAITPEEPTSALELAYRIDQVLSALGANPLGLKISAEGVIAWSASSVFTLAASGNLATRINLAASATGSTVSTLGPHADGFYPAEGMIVRRPFLASTSQPPIADGSSATMIQPVPTKTEIIVQGSMSDLWSLEDDFSADQLFDYQSGSVFQGRLRVLSVKRVRDGRLHTRGHLRLEGQAVFDKGPA